MLLTTAHTYTRLRDYTLWNGQYGYTSAIFFSSVNSKFGFIHIPTTSHSIHVHTNERDWHNCQIEWNRCVDRRACVCEPLRSQFIWRYVYVCVRALCYWYVCVRACFRITTDTAHSTNKHMRTHEYEYTIAIPCTHRHVYRVRLNHSRHQSTQSSFIFNSLVFFDSSLTCLGSAFLNLNVTIKPYTYSHSHARRRKNDRIKYQI